jgi:2-isopropylmalate synthase
MLTCPATKYQSFQPIHLPDRTWPTQTITKPPIWLSTDLRDGNQALVEPMNLAQKLQMFNLLVQLGFKDIEVGFPSASQVEFNFIRHLIECCLIPDQVTIQVLVPARADLIYRTFAALEGVPRAIVHVYNATAPAFRRIVFGRDQTQTIELATTAAQLIYDLAAEHSETQWQFQYSPEVFTSTELEFARDICNAVLEIWQPTPDRKAIINLPASVEVATPNVFADQVEWMHRHLIPRDSVILCVHTHNDRGCSVAAAELAQMAGAERVEGCLFGNGERTGNVDIVTLAMNLYTQGIYPGLDFSQIDTVVQVTQGCTQLPIHPRHPYAGELVFTAFSGSHQDAIKKGFAVQQLDALWQVPYLPMDPADVGRTYESVVRVNSQSGKGGIAFLLERDYGLVLPRSLQVEFSQIAQRAMDLSGQELSAADLWQLFTHEYLQGDPFKYRSHQMIEAQAGWKITAELEYEEQPLTVQGQGNGPIDAFSKALGQNLQVHHYEERALGYGSDAVAIAIIQLDLKDTQETHHGVGMHNNIVTASLLAVLSALNRSNR